MVVLVKDKFELMLEESLGLTELNFGEVRAYGLPQTKEERRKAVTGQLRADSQRVHDSTIRFMDNYAEAQARARKESPHQIYKVNKERRSPNVSGWWEPSVF